MTTKPEKLILGTGNHVPTLPSIAYFLYVICNDRPNIILFEIYFVGNDHLIAPWNEKINNTKALCTIMWGPFWPEQKWKLSHGKK